MEPQIEWFTTGAAALEWLRARSLPTPAGYYFHAGILGFIHQLPGDLVPMLETVDQKRCDGLVPEAIGVQVEVGLQLYIQVLTEREWRATRAQRLREAHRCLTIAGSQAASVMPEGWAMLGPGRYGETVVSRGGAP